VSLRAEQIAQGLDGIRWRIDAATRAAGRDDHVDLVVVTKTFPASDVQILAGLGVTEVAENRDQEARAKRLEVEQALGDGAAIPRWHMIGQIQRNKANSIARWADVIESVDRLELVPALARAARAADRTLEVLVQVSLDPGARADRGGATDVEAREIAAAVVGAAGLNLTGVMGVAPYPGDPDEAFARLQMLAAQIQATWPAADRISAGMSGDLEQAVARGATQVRVGGAVLGVRPPVQ
jgi:pyridoxal phosphate enzyme (YggS family)